LRNLAEVLVPCLDAAGARSVTEIGAYAGDLTGLLVEWAARTGGRVRAIDPFPQERLVRLAEERAELELVRETSLAALPGLPPSDAVVVDGDHNYHTVSEELRLIAEAAGERLPLLLFHDVCWPHARRDDYYTLEAVPPERRQPVAEGGGLFPGDPGVRPGALPYRFPAAREGGPRNGVLTAVEDFVASRPRLRLAVVPAFFGLGVVWERDAPWAGALAAVVEPWEGNTIVARLEANRVFHLATAHLNLAEVRVVEERMERQTALLRRMLESSAFRVAERLSRLRVRAGVATNQSEISRAEVRRALGE
jgi:hypothetical protein